MSLAEPLTGVHPWSYETGRLRLLDQRRLPHEEVWLECESAAQAAEAIRTLAVRGAPLIGVAAAFGLAAEAHRVASRSEADLDVALRMGAERLLATRPTAVNLAAALARMAACAASTVGRTASERAKRLEGEARDIAEEDRLACLTIGRNGAAWLEGRLPKDDELSVLTHCNAGALATSGIGTALGVVRVLAGRHRLTVWADETRPFWQGTRLTAWELERDGIPVILLPDVAAAAMIASGRVSAVVVGADRIARNGDVANKVGTYGLALACRAHSVPFVVAAPTTTLDPDCREGSEIPIEMRDADEVLRIMMPGAEPIRLAPPGVNAVYPAFDVTPAALVDAIITEAGVSEPPHESRLQHLMGPRGARSFGTC